VFDLERTEKYIILILVMALIIAAGLTAYKRSCAAPRVKVERFDVAPVVKRASAGEVPEAGRVNINTADVKELMGLKRVGAVLARRIVDYRTAHGAFITTTDIKNVNGIGEALYEKIKDDISTE